MNGDAATDKARPEPATSADGRRDRHENNGVRHGPEPAAPAWPRAIDAAAFHGLAGKIVRTILPASEADPVALLVQTLTAFGNVVGRGRYFEAEADHHHGNEFVVLVGRTSKARKGSSWGHIERLMARAEEQWAKERLQTGASSGEGIIHAVRDPVMKRECIKERGKPPRYEEVEADPGVLDKRLLIYEPEYANVLKQTERMGNTLSVVLRNAWDGRDLQTLTKNSPTSATGAHVSMIGHITADELRRYLTQTEQANGFGNRHLWICIQRSKTLPDGGKVDGADLLALADALADAMQFSKTCGVMRRSEDAVLVWREVYGPLSDGKPGLTGAVLARAEAHVMRLAMLYALLDRSPQIRAAHLMAALAVWEYCERSVKFIFGDSIGDPVADELLRVLRAAGPQGATRTEMLNYFGRNRSTDRIGRALGMLLEHRLARMEKSQPQGPGRPEERWYAAEVVPGN
jgi:hypothetical protein